jgi:UDP-glucuronate decarboxylase
LAKERLNWEPKYPLDEGLRKTIEYFDGCLRRGFEIEYRPTLVAL